MKDASPAGEILLQGTHPVGACDVDHERKYLHESTRYVYTSRKLSLCQFLSFKKELTLYGGVGG